METRRKILGKRIQRDRMRAGYLSARAFADAITERYGKISERSVAGAETGEERIGRKVLGKIEEFLGYPNFSFTRFLETGDESGFEQRDPTKTGPRRGAHDDSTPAPRSVMDLSRADLFHLADLVAADMGDDLATDLVRTLLQVQAERRRADGQGVQVFEGTGPTAD
jgi:hypothetical protein